MAKIDITASYPYSEDYEYETKMVRLDLNQEMVNDISKDNGFVIGKPKGIKKDLKSQDSIFSSKFGQTLKDLNPFADRFKCECGYYRSAINNNSICPICHTRVKYVGDNFSYFGWIVLQGDNHYIIHPGLYKSISAFVGKDVLPDILNYDNKRDKDGHVLIMQSKPEGNPYYRIGMIEFREKFQEIMDYYMKVYSSNKSKREYYNDIMRDKDKVFIQSIPVFTTLLRPVDNNAKTLYYEDTNGIYNMMNKFAWELNDFEAMGMDNKKKSTANLTLLWDLQNKYNTLYDRVDSILQGKKGALRSLLAGRYNFSSRCVIVSNPKLRIYQIKLPYKCLVELLQQKIINILQKTYSISYSDAYNIWYKANMEENSMVKNIINTLINTGADGKGIPFIINRNPTIAYGSIILMYCIGMTNSYSLEIPLQVLEGLAADFDGDVLNILMIISEAFYKRADQIYNPRNAMYISRNDGKFNNSVNHQRDTIINTNTFIRLGRSMYTKEMLDNIKRIKNKYK